MRKSPERGAASRGDRRRNAPFCANVLRSHARYRSCGLLGDGAANERARALALPFHCASLHGSLAGRFFTNGGAPLHASSLAPSHASRHPAWSEKRLPSTASKPSLGTAAWGRSTARPTRASTREARALARLDDPGIVRVHALRESVKGVYIVMEYVEGRPLGAYLDEHGPLPPGEAVALFLPVLRAVGHAHEAGVLHRDLKPSNLIVPAGFTPGEGPPVKITDFGLAKIRSADTQLTAPGETSGTAGYMAPEQVEGLREADERSDLFALGMMLYEALAGRPPFDRDQTTFAVQRHVVEEPFKPPVAFAPGVPGGLSAAVMKALAKDPSERAQSADVLHAALAPFAAGEASAAPASPAAGSNASERPAWLPGSAWLAKRIPGASTLTAALLFAGACALLGGALWAARSFLPAPSGSGPVTRSASTADARAPAAGEAPAATRLSVRSAPTGATVYLDGDSAGTTPLRDAPVEPGSVRVRVQKPGFPGFDTTLTAARGSRTDFRMRLAPVRDEPVRDEEASPPAPGAPDARDVRRATDRASNDEALPAERAAVLNVRLDPSGTLAIDGAVVARSTDAFHTDTLAPGTHTLTLTHPELGTRTERVSLEAGDERTRVFDLRETKRVRITARTPDGDDVPSAAVTVDGTLRKNKVTPGPFALRLGRRTIEVQKAGYTDAERTLEIHDDLAGAVVFTLRHEEES
ncbi:MAG: hypothetical protein BRD48_03455 [Bacteroidetes bacterium QS_9_68_14]|nr:MAG: hypothetical protein BRD48_03455 [Bacteroidetes bacterium QS_9_68_14]